MFYVFIGMAQGVIDDVQIFQDVKDAKKRFKKYTGVTWEDYRKKIKEPNTDDCDILGEDYEGTGIYPSDVHEKESYSID